MATDFAPVHTPDAWPEAEPAWVNLAPGVRWLLREPDGMDRQIVTSTVSSAMAKVYQGRAALDIMGADFDDPSAGLLDLERIRAFGEVMTATEMAMRCLKAWEGITDPSSGQPLDHTDRNNVRAALVKGPPPGGIDLLSPFLAWAEGPQHPQIAEVSRLRKRASDYWGGGAERCRACEAKGESCALGGSIDGELCPQVENTPQTYEASWLGPSPRRCPAYGSAPA